MFHEILMPKKKKGLRADNPARGIVTHVPLFQTTASFVVNASPLLACYSEEAKTPVAISVALWDIS